MRIARTLRQLLLLGRARMEISRDGPASSANPLSITNTLVPGLSGAFWPLGKRHFFFEVFGSVLELVYSVRRRRRNCG